MRPYNTRHKTLSLHSLGIHVPGSHASRAPANRGSSMASPASPSKNSQPPTKRLKRAYSESSDDAPPVRRLSKKRDDTVKFENTPPPSPPTSRRPSIEISEDEDTAPKAIDMESINDEIVEAVIVLLQNSGNRPHLVKELAAVLMLQLKIVQQSANPCAIVSSRLASYLKRSTWSALTPCPLAKELESVHPRRTYFYLTTRPHLPLPDPSQASSTMSFIAHTRSIISPSPSSAPSMSADESDMERRRELSPSPEVDLSSPEFDDMDDDSAMPGTPVGSFSMRGFYMPSRPIQSTSARHGRAGSPPLEKDEKEFTQTADGLQKRKLNGDLSSASSATPADQTASIMDLERDESPLFGVIGGFAASFVSSPAIRPSTMSLNFGKKDGEVDGWAKFEGMLEWDRSPENIELEELDGLLIDF
ncbi:hypothetical protein B0I37DRAFT_205450 [Chaetomium sp. MPI-CAGE-AT-0009]|nr:hypothetical protein B0I37DRAFT_205450 [Chaetomium sp. MPI-CAGE-AT-0009]